MVLKAAKGWIGVDLDGTLAHYDGWDPEIGKPIQPMVKRVKNWLANGQEVKIFTARILNHDGSIDEQMVKKIHDWCLKQFGQVLDVTNAKDGNMIQLWDDRAVMVVKNKGIAVHEHLEKKVRRLARMGKTLAKVIGAKAGQ